MSGVPLLEAGRAVLVAPAPDDPPWRMVVEIVQDDHVTLATHDDEVLPLEWRELPVLHVTTLDRFSVHLIEVPVVRIGSTRIVIGAPDESTPVQRRAYARVCRPVAASGMLLELADNRWIPFAAEVRDLGGGGCSAFADVHAPEGATIVLSLALDEGAPVVVVGHVLPREALPTIGRPLVRIEFALIREADRDRILRFVLLTLASLRHGRRGVRAAVPRTRDS